MRMIFALLSLLLMATPAVSQVQVQPQLGLDKAGSSRRITIFDPQKAGTDKTVTIGTLDGNTFNPKVTAASLDDPLGLVAASLTSGEIEVLSISRRITIDRPIAIGGSMTFRSPVRFVGDGRLTIAAGANVFFNADSQPIIPDELGQVFYGAGGVRGLRKAKVLSFAGSLLNTTADSTTLLQKAADAVVYSGKVEFPTGYFAITGSTPITFSNAQQVYGESVTGSKVLWTSTATNGFVFSGGSGASLKNMTVAAASQAVAPSTGTAVLVQSSFFTAEKVGVDGGSDCFRVDGPGAGSIAGGRFYDLDLNNCQNVGLSFNNVNDMGGNHLIISAPVDRLYASSVGGTTAAKVGDILTGATSGATARIVSVSSPTSFRVTVDAVNFTAGETVTAPGGVSFVLSSQLVPHALGCLRATNKVEAWVLDTVECIGGVWGLTTDAAINGPNSRPAHNRLVNVFFDSSDNGVLFDKIVDLDCTNCWFSNRPADYGFTVGIATDLRFSGGGARNNYKNGGRLTASAQYISFNNFSFTGNGVAAANTYVGLDVDPGATYFSVTNSRIGGTLGWGTQKHAIRLNNGPTDHFIISNNMLGENSSTSILDGSTGTNKTITGNQ